MSSITNNTPSFEEMETMIQDQLIDLIKVNMDIPRIRFWDPEERIADSVIFSTYPVIYNIMVYVENTSKKSKKNGLEIFIGRNFSNYYSGGNLPSEVRASFRNFARIASKTLCSYFSKRDSLYVGKLRFDLLPDDKEWQYAIPNLVLSDNIWLYRSIAAANSSHNKDGIYDTERVPYEDYINSRLEDYVAEQQFAEMLKRPQTNKESS